MNKLLPFAILILAVSIFSGCAQDSSSDGPVIAKIDKGAITEDQFLKEVTRVPEWARAQFKGIEGKEKFLDELVKRELIYQEALKMKLDNDKEYVAKVKEFKKMTLVSLILKKEVEDKVRIDESEIKTFFDENEDKFTIGTQIKASHILVKDEELANSIHEKISKGENFEKLAREHSIDKGSAEKGGDLGYFGQGKMVPEFERAALSLKPGEVSKPVKTRFGTHIIKLFDIKKGDPANFEQTKVSIQKQLMVQKRKTLFDSYVEKLKGKSTVTTNKDNLEAIILPWEQSEESGQSEKSEQSEQPEPGPEDK